MSNADTWTIEQLLAAATVEAQLATAAALFMTAPDGGAVSYQEKEGAKINALQHRNRALAYLATANARPGPHT